MAKIWYSVFGEGYGHATRSAPIIEELQKKHTLLITGFNKSYSYLKERFPKLTHKIEGPGFVYESNEVKIPATVIEFIKSLPKKSGKNIVHSFNLIKKFKPDLIISDFEPTSHYFAYFLGIPIVSIDNMNVLARCEVDVKKEDFLDYLSALSVINLFSPKSDYRLILTLKDFKIKEKNVLLFPPILRKEVLETKPHKKNFILVYQTSKTNFTNLIDGLKKIKENFIIYGLNKSEKNKNILFKKFSKKEFIEDLSSCKAVIMTGGFTTISEAIYFKKPMLIIPAKNQFEQKFNGEIIKKMKIGECAESINNKKIKSFVSKINYYQKNLKKVKTWDNSKLLAKLEELIEKLKSRPKPVFKFVRKVEDFFRIHKYERTLTIIKPDAVEKGLIGEVIKRLEKQGVKPVAMKMVKMKKGRAESFYNHLKNKIPESVFNSIVKYMTSNRVVLIVWQGKGAVKKVRKICGPTDPKKAKKYNIRSLSKEDMEKRFKRGKAVRNIIHSSATTREAKKEIRFFFMPWEIHKP